MKSHAARENPPAVGSTFCFLSMIRDACSLLRHSGTGTKFILNLKMLSRFRHAIKSMALAVVVAAPLLHLTSQTWSAAEFKGMFTAGPPLDGHAEIMMDDFTDQ